MKSVKEYRNHQIYLIRTREYVKDLDKELPNIIKG